MTIIWYTTNLLYIILILYFTPNWCRNEIQWFMKFEITSYCSHLHRKSAPFQVEYKLPLSPWLQGGIRFFQYALPSWPFSSITRFVPIYIGANRVYQVSINWLSTTVLGGGCSPTALRVTDLWRTSTNPKQLCFLARCIKIISPPSANEV